MQMVGNQQLDAVCGGFSTDSGEVGEFGELTIKRIGELVFSDGPACILRPGPRIDVIELETFQSL